MPYGYKKGINNHKRPHKFLKFIKGIDFFYVYFELKPIRTKMLVSCIEDITTILGENECRERWILINLLPISIIYLFTVKECHSQNLN